MTRGASSRSRAERTSGSEEREYGRSRLGEMMQDKDPEKANRVMKAVLQMKKLDIAELKRAYEQR